MHDLNTDRHMNDFWAESAQNSFIGIVALMVYVSEAHNALLK